MKLKLNNISKIYSKKTIDEKLALSNISFEIDPPGVFGIIGHNGSGKSTLSYIISTFIKQSSGEIYFNNKLKTRKVSRKVKKNIGYCFQNPDNQILKTNIFDEVSFGAKNIKMLNWEALTLETLDKFGLSNIKSDSPYKKSQGEKRKISIASSTNQNPDLLIFDEPTANLDNESKLEVINSIKELSNQEKLIFIISHDMNLIYELCKKVICLHEGNLELIESSEKFFNNEKLLTKYKFETPKIIKLKKHLKIKNEEIKSKEDFIKKYGSKI